MVNVGSSTSVAGGSARNTYYSGIFVCDIVAIFLLAFAFPAQAQQTAQPCDAPANEVVAENCKPGSPQGEWDVNGSGSESIQGFATDMSVNQGATARFKVKTDATDYRLDVYRIGYYDGDGARKVTTIQPSAALPQNQPGCETQSDVGLVDCGTWAVSASWQVPADAVSGIYFAKLMREDGTAGASHIENRPPRPPPSDPR